MRYVLIFGDSVAAGRNVKKIKSWPLLLANHIDRTKGKRVLVYNLSIGGDTTTDLVSRFTQEIKARYKKQYPDDRRSVIFAIGLNDSKDIIVNKSSKKASISKFVSNLKTLIKEAAAFSDRICFVGLNPVNETKMRHNQWPFTNQSIVDYNNIIKNICKEYGVGFIEIFDSCFAKDAGRLLSDDGLHPNELGHQKIFKAIIKNCPEILE